MDNIKITLETLYDILRNEKKKEELQKLEDSFFIDVVSYLKEKKALLDNKDNSDDPFAAGEKDKVEYELRSIKRILKEIYEKREKKILDIALNKSKTRSDFIDTSSMLKEEKDFYNESLETFDKFRFGVVGQLFKGEMPSISGEKKVVEKKVEKPKEKKEELKEEMTKIKFKHAMPSFVWKDMKVYGPYDEGEKTEIFPEVADLLVRKGRAEKV